MDEICSLILKEKLIVILRGIPKDCLEDVSKAVIRGGVKLMEVTFNQKSQDPILELTTQLETIREAVGDQLCLGAGTVLTIEQVEAAYRAGAKYIISPNSSMEVIRRTKELGMVSIPGAMTPTEIANAWQWGADIIKLFPADDLGCHYIKNVKAPLSHIPLLATGGVNPDTIPLFLEAGAVGVGTGISIAKPELIAARDFDGIADLARAHVEAVHRARV